jgi:hypothetical protein
MWTSALLNRRSLEDIDAVLLDYFHLWHRKIHLVIDSLVLILLDRVLLLYHRWSLCSNLLCLKCIIVLLKHFILFIISILLLIKYVLVINLYPLIFSLSCLICLVLWQYEICALLNIWVVIVPTTLIIILYHVFLEKLV